jgi:hypothetical protein
MPCRACAVHNGTIVYEVVEYGLAQPCGALRPRAQPAERVSWLELFHQEVFAADEATAQVEQGQGRAAHAFLVREAVKELDPCI